MAQRTATPKRLTKRQEYGKALDDLVFEVRGPWETARHQLSQSGQWAESPLDLGGPLEIEEQIAALAATADTGLSPSLTAYVDGLRLALQCDTRVRAFVQEWRLPEGTYESIFLAADLPPSHWRRRLPMMDVGCGGPNVAYARLADREERQEAWRRHVFRSRPNAGRMSLVKNLPPGVRDAVERGYAIKRKHPTLPWGTIAEAHLGENASTFKKWRRAYREAMGREPE
jgi:hypothetical protein